MRIVIKKFRLTYYYEQTCELGLELCNAASRK